MTCIVQRRPDGADAAIHHIRRGNYVTTGGGLHDCLLCQDVQGLVVDHISVAEKPVMSVVGKWV